MTTPRLLVKARNPGYTRKDGTVVRPFYDSRPTAKDKLPALVKPKPNPKAPGPVLIYKPDAVPPLPAAAQKKSPAASAGLGGLMAWGKKLQDDWKAKQQAKGQTGSLFGVGEWSGEDHRAAGFKKPPAKVYPNAIAHPKVNDDGKVVMINEPSLASTAEAIADPVATALFLPGGSTPAELHGVPFAPWADRPQTEDEWDFVDGQMDDLEEPALKLTGAKEPAAGIVMEEPDGRVWIVRPTNGYASYRATFPKGHREYGMSLQATAIKEVWEESGLKAKITGFLGDVVRGQTVTRYYRGVRVGGTPADCGWETQAVALVPKEQLTSVLNAPVDHPMAYRIGAPKLGEDITGWQQVGPQRGSNTGGTFLDTEGTPWYCKFYGSTSRAKNEVLASKLYEAAGVRTPEVKLVYNDGEIGVASRIVPGLKQDQPALVKGAPGVREGFAADAWLANWDSVGLVYDNLLLDANGEAVRVDTGGALLYRAQGGPKGGAFGDKVGEVNSLRSGQNAQAQAVFKGVTKEQMREGVQRIAAIPEATILDLVKQFGPGAEKERAALAKRILARRADLIDRFGK